MNGSEKSSFTHVRTVLIYVPPCNTHSCCESNDLRFLSYPESRTIIKADQGTDFMLRVGGTNTVRNKLET